jgi:hypothetical protein
VVAVNKVNPVTQPPSAANDIIVSCHDSSTLCYRDVPLKPFQLLLQTSAPSSYVSAVHFDACIAVKANAHRSCDAYEKRLLAVVLVHH